MPPEDGEATNDVPEGVDPAQAVIMREVNALRALGPTDDVAELSRRAMRLAQLARAQSAMIDAPKNSPFSIKPQPGESFEMGKMPGQHESVRKQVEGGARLEPSGYAGSPLSSNDSRNALRADDDSLEAHYARMSQGRWKGPR